MKVVLAFLLFAVSAFAQNPMAVATAACGPKKVSFDVMTNPAQHSLELPEPGKARVYFVQDLGTQAPLGVGGAQVTRVGIDGAWVGANNNNSYFSVSVEPGEHHICVNAQTHLFKGVMEFAHFTAEAGKVYYFRTRDFLWQTRRLEFAPVDSDQARYMIAAYPRSIAHAKK